MTKPTPRLGTTAGGTQEMHFSAGALIVRDEKVLMIERVQIPLGYAGLAGHVDVGEDAQTAILREVFEESGMRVVYTKMLFKEEVHDNTCGYGINVHYWTLFACTVEGEPCLDPHEAASIGFYRVRDVAKFSSAGLLEPVWKHWFIKAGLLN